MTGGITTQENHRQSRQTSPLHAVQHQNNRPHGELQRKKSRETIHSGHFMVSDFEAEGRDEDDEVSIPVPDGSEDSTLLSSVGEVNVNSAGDLAGIHNLCAIAGNTAHTKKFNSTSKDARTTSTIVEPQDHYSRNLEFRNFEKMMQDSFGGPSVTIDQSLTKLFQCMSLAYSAKLTSPRWKNFKGLRLQWKDKIRLNNLIWRCWHMQFVERRNTAVCQFASPLDVDQHNKPEAVVLEGKYWKRRLATVTAEYKKWRIFYKNKIMGRTSKDHNDTGICGELDHLDWSAPRSNGSYNSGSGSVVPDDDFYMDFSDTLFSSLTSNQPFPFPNPREIAKGASLADFIQPGLIQLQPNLDDFMDTFEPLHDLLSGRLPPVEEEIVPVEEIQIQIPNSNSVQQPSSHRREYTIPDQMPYPSTTSEPSRPQQMLNPIDNYMPMDVSHAEPPFLSTNQYPTESPMAIQEVAVESPLTFDFPPVTTSPQSNNTTYMTTSMTSQLGKPQQQRLMVSGGFTSPSLGSGATFDSAITVANNVATTSSSFQQATMDGFAVPQGKPRSRSRSGSSVITPNPGNCGTMQSNAQQFSLSNSQPCLASTPSSCNTVFPARTNRGRGKGNNSSSNSSPARLNPTAADPSGSGGSRSTVDRNRGRIRSASDLQPILSASEVSTSSAAVPTRTFIPDNTLLAQLLTGATSAGTPATTLVLTTDSSSQRIPLIFPIQNAEPPAPLSSDKTVTLLPATFTSEFINVTDIQQQQLKREQTVSQPSLPVQQGLDVLAGAAVSQKNGRNKVENERGQYKEHRRVCHINAEQKRRCNIKNGFDTLQSLLPGIGSSSSCGNGSSGSSGSSGHGKCSEVSKAAMLQRGAEYIRQLRQERQQQLEEMEQLKQSIESLNSAISGCQALLPATGAPVSRQRTNRMREMFDEWVRVRTLQNWKFWIFSTLIQPLLESYSSAVAGSTVEDLWRTVLSWVDQHCSLIALRPVVLNSLRHLSKTTDILTDPSRLPAEAAQAVCNTDKSTANLSSST